MNKLSLLLLLLISHIGIAQHRVDRPVQVQANFSGLFVDLAANSLADATVDDLNVNTWLPGISLGYHLSRYLYVGYSFYAPLDLTMQESWGLTSRALDADIVLEHQPGATHLVEARISPFKFGLYASLGYANIGKVDYQMDFVRKGETVWVGNNAYATDLEIDCNSKNVHALMVGLGYNHVFKNGFSFTLGMSLPTGFPKDENIRVNGDVDILASDIALAELQIQEETFYGPVVLHLNVGYNLAAFWKSK